MKSTSGSMFGAIGGKDSKGSLGGGMFRNSVGGASSAVAGKPFFGMNK